MLLFFLVLSLSSAKCQEDISSWTNGRYTTSRTKNPEVGETLFLSVQVKSDANELWDGLCHATTPTGEIWALSQYGYVYDEDTNIVAGVEGNMTTYQCWLSVITASADDFGDWRLEIYGHRDDGEVIKPYPTFIITTDNLVTDVRLPTSFTPRHYDVRLVPDFESTGSNIKYEGSVTMFVESNVYPNKLLTFHMDELTLVGTPLIKECLTSTLCSTDSPIWIIYDFQRTFVHLQKAGSYYSRTEYEVSMNFTADISSRGGYYTYGFYPQVCSETNGNPKLCWFTQVSCHSCHPSCHTSCH